MFPASKTVPGNHRSARRRGRLPGRHRRRWLGTGGHLKPDRCRCPAPLCGGNGECGEFVVTCAVVSAFAVTIFLGVWHEAAGLMDHGLAVLGLILGGLPAAFFAGCTLHENTVEFTVRPGAKSGKRPVVIGESPRGVGQLVTNSARTVAGRRSSLRLTATANGGWILSGNIGIGAPARRLTSVANNPEAVLRAAWGRALKDAGIEWDLSFALASAGGDPLEDTAVLAQVESATLDSLASEVNTRSLNIGAELLLRWAGGATNAAEKLMAHIRSVTGATTGVYLVDGSGLSSDDRIAPSVFISYLTRFPQTPEGKNFPLLLPANGEGTLGRLAGSGRGVVRAKTGTLGNVSSLVGYLGRPDGVLVVTLMYNGEYSHTARQEQWRLFRTLGADAVSIPADETPDAEPAQLGGENKAPETRCWGLDPSDS